MTAPTALDRSARTAPSLALGFLQVWAGLLLLLWSGATPYPTYLGPVIGFAFAAALISFGQRGRASRTPWWLAVTLASAVGAGVQVFVEGAESPPPGSTTWDNLLAMLETTLGQGLWNGGVLFGGGLALVVSAIRFPARTPSGAAQPGDASAATSAPRAVSGRWRSAARGAALLLIILTAFEPACTIHDWKVDSYRAAMRFDLRELATAEDRFWNAHLTFTADTAELEYAPSTGVRLTIVHADSSGWRAEAAHVLLTTTCTLAGTAKSSTPSPRPRCRRHARWF